MIREIAGNQVVEKTPFLFDLAQAGIDRNIKGSWRLLTLLQNTILRGKVAAYQLDGVQPVTVYTPLFRPESSKTKSTIAAYDSIIADDIVDLLKAAPDENRQYWFVDVGADIGMVSAQMIRNIDKIEQIFAFEPNDASRPYLEAMLSELAITTYVSAAAVGSKDGTGRMVSPPEDKSEHARFFANDTSGPIKMRSLNSLPSPKGKTVILKIDVEGGEVDVVRGAEAFLKKADNFIATFEAHPGVIDRTKKTPDEVWKLLNDIKPCTLTLTGKPFDKFNMTRPICDQIPNYRIGVHNLICSTI